MNRLYSNPTFNHFLHFNLFIKSTQMMAPQTIPKIHALTVKGADVAKKLKDCHEQKR